MGDGETEVEVETEGEGDGRGPNSSAMCNGPAKGLEKRAEYGPSPAGRVVSAPPSAAPRRVSRLGESPAGAQPRTNA